VVRFFAPQVNLFVADCARAARFYGALGFRETYRDDGDPPVKVELVLDGATLALPGPAAASHGIDPVTRGHRACVTLWTDDVGAARQVALDAGAHDNQAPHPFLDGRLRIAMVEDPDGHPVQLVERVAPAPVPVAGGAGREG
jgi:catechol 2,3-dioxygenase-like lactoylglutathione lyase family enzyme